MQESSEELLIQRGSETIRCGGYANDVMVILLNRAKSTNTLWEKLLPLLWEIETANNHLDADLLFDKLLIEAKLFNRMLDGKPS